MTQGLWLLQFFLLTNQVHNLLGIRWLRSVTIIQQMYGLMHPLWEALNFYCILFVYFHYFLTYFVFYLTRLMFFCFDLDFGFFSVFVKISGGCCVVTWSVAAFVGLQDLFRTRTPSIGLGLCLLLVFICILASFTMDFISSIDII